MILGLGRAGAAVCAALAGMAATAAVAGGAPISLDLSARSYADALIEIGVRADLSLLNVAACRGSAPALRGRYEPREAIARLLRQAPCRFEFLDATTVRFTAQPTPPPPPPRLVAQRPPPAAAPSTGGENELQAVVITAQKRSELLLNTAAAVSVVRASRLAETSSLDLTDVAAQLAAVVVTNLGPGRDKLLLRGVSDGAFTGRTRSTVATYLDDAPITYNAPDPDLVLVDVDRVEILRGPQGALYGGGSIGGVYRIVSKTPDLNRFGGELRLRGSSIDGGGTGGGVEATINAPLIAGRAGLRASLYDIDDAGYLQNDATRQSNVDHTYRRGGRVLLTAKPHGDWSITLSGVGQRLVTADTQYTTSTGPALRRANLVREAHTNNFTEAGLTVTGPAGPLSLHSATSYVRHSYASRYDASAALSLFDDPFAQLGVYDESTQSEMVVQDVYASTPAGQRLGLVLGGLASRLSTTTTSRLNSTAAGATAATTLFSEDRRDRVDELALYGEATARLSRRWSASVGARVFKTSVSVVATTLTPRQAVASRMLSADKAHEGVSPKVSLQYAVNARTSLYALVSSGERAGGFNTGGLRAATRAQATYKPDVLINYEAGFKTAFADGRAELSTTAFHDRWRAIQTDQFYASGLPFTANVGTGSLDGLETDVAARLGGLTLEANALLTKSNLDRVESGFARALNRPLPGAPSVAVATLAEYRRALTSRVDLLVGGRAAYVGRAPLTFDVSPTSAVNSSYVDAALWAQLITRRYRLALNVSNPSGAHANTFAYGNPFSFGQVRQATPQRPRTIEVSLTATF